MMKKKSVALFLIPLFVLTACGGTVATALLAQHFLGQRIDTAGWVGMAFIVVGLGIITQWSNIDV